MTFFIKNFRIVDQEPWRNFQVRFQRMENQNPPRKTKNQTLFG